MQLQLKYRVGQVELRVVSQAFPKKDLFIINEQSIWRLRWTIKWNKLQHLSTYSLRRYIYKSG